LTIIAVERAAFAVGVEWQRRESVQNQ